MANADKAGRNPVLRFVCRACNGVYFQPVNGACPGCKGPIREAEVVYDDAGVAHVQAAGVAHVQAD